MGWVILIICVFVGVSYACYLALRNMKDYDEHWLRDDDWPRMMG